ncbi:MAG: DNA polymerase III subunit gamma/tau [Verrucomicrobiae bacterium]|nr:DNA polymerase III subunit gamma/tau [Verrucomicrobiae bacterium]
MSYQVIARKYRPQRFADVIGQEHVTQTLASAIQQNRIAHAYIFCGPRGTGKTTIARIFAKCLNCTGGPKVDFDDHDERVKEITEGRALDVLEIDGASNNGVEQVRELRETCQYMPANGKFKIYIIDEVHMLSTAAFNALLKTLEEPPAHVKFMFATTDPEKVLPTILSRCQRFDLRRIPMTMIINHLTEIATKEGVKADAGALYAIARGADGGMRDAESALDQLISFCGDTIQETDALTMFGLTGQQQILALGEAILTGDIQAALRQLTELIQQGKDPGRLLSDLLGHIRNLILFQVSKGDLELLQVSEADGSALKEQSQAVSTEALTHILEVLSDAELRLRDAASKKILLEVTLLRAIEARQAVSLDTVLKQLRALREQAGGAPSLPLASLRDPRPVTPPKPTAPPPKPVVQETPPPPAPAAKAKSSLSGEKLTTLWKRLLESAGQASPFIRTYLLEAHPVSFEDDLLTIGFDPEFDDHRGLVDHSRNHAVLQTKLAELGFAGARVKFICAEAPADWVRPAPESATPESKTPPVATGKSETSVGGKKPAANGGKGKTSTRESFNPEDFKNDPLIQKALEIFKGEIVEVRT